MESGWAVVQRGGAMEPRFSESGAEYRYSWCRVGERQCNATTRTPDKANVVQQIDNINEPRCAPRRLLERLAGVHGPAREDELPRVPGVIPDW